MIPIRLITKLARVAQNEPQTAWKIGSTIRAVRCEGCQNVYSYILERKAFGQAESRKAQYDDIALGQAQTIAESSLTEQLSFDFDCVPCPACGHFQKNMARRLKYGSLRRLAVVSVCIELVSSVLVAFIADYKNIFFLEWLQLLLIAVVVVARAFVIVFRSCNPLPGSPVGPPHPLIVTEEEASSRK